MPPSLSALERKILEIVHADNRRGRRSTLATIEIALDEADAKRVGNSLIGRSCWDLEKLGLLATVKPTVTISEKGEAVIGKPVETPAPEPEPVQAEAAPVAPPEVPPAVFERIEGETKLQTTARLLAAYPDGLTAPEVRNLTGLDLSGPLSHLRNVDKTVFAFYREGQTKLTYRLLPVESADDASPGVAPAPVASPVAGPATVEDVSAVAVVAPVADAAPAMVVEMVEAVADAIAAESLSERLAKALSRVVGSGYSVESDESEPCGVIIGTDDGVINVEIRPVRSAVDRHIVWISPEGGMGVSLDDAILAAIRAVGVLTGPDEAALELTEAEREVQVHLGTIQVMQRAVQSELDEFADALGLGPDDKRTWAAMIDRVRILANAEKRVEAYSAQINQMEHEHNEHIAAEHRNRRTELSDALGLQFEVGRSWITLLDHVRSGPAGDAELRAKLAAALGLNADPGWTWSRLLDETVVLHGAHKQWMRDAEEANAKLAQVAETTLSDCARSFANELADALGMNIEDTDPSRAVATLLDEVRRRKPVQKLIAEARQHLSDVHAEQMRTLNAAGILLVAK